MEKFVLFFIMMIPVIMAFALIARAFYDEYKEFHYEDYFYTEDEYVERVSRFLLDL